MTASGTTGIPASLAITIGQMRKRFDASRMPTRHPNHSGNVMIRLPSHSRKPTTWLMIHTATKTTSHTILVTQLTTVITTHTIPHTTSVITVVTTSQMSSSGHGSQLHTVSEIVRDTLR